VKFKHLQGRLKRMPRSTAEACAKAGRRDAGHGRGQGYRMAGSADQAHRRGHWSGLGGTKMMRRAQWH